MKQKIHTLIYKISIAVIGLAVLSLFYIGYMVFWPYQTINFTKTENIEVVNKTLKHGEDVQIKVSYCRHTDTQATVTRELHDGLIYLMPEITTHTGKGCQTDRILSMGEIPNALPDGKYTMLITLQFKVNALRTITQTLATEPFTVVK